MKLRKFIFFAFIAGTIMGCSAGKLNRFPDQQENYSRLVSQIDERFNDSMFSHAHWGVLIKSLRTGKVWYERNSTKMFMPASNQKIPTTAAALSRLGPDFRFETNLSYSGAIKDSVLNGDLVIWSNGDPTLYSRFYNDPREVFWSFADSLKKLGINKITGNIIADDNAFDDWPFGSGWPLDDLDSYYSAEIGPLQLNEVNVDLTVIPPDSVNGEIIIEPNLPSAYYTIINRLEATDTGSTDYTMTRAYGTNQIIFQGRIKTRTQPFEITPSIHNPSLFYVTVLREVLSQKGINVAGVAKDCDDIPLWMPPLNNVLIRHYSPPLKEIIKGLMKRSQNLYAETMVKTLGWKYSGTGSFRAGRKIVEEVLNSFGIQPGTYSFRDGSGLSRYNYISPEQEVKILTSMYNSEYKQAWIESFPIAGVDGTLKNRMKSSSAQGNVKAKTGTISNVRGLSGYVTTGGGEPLVFSFLINGHLRGSSETDLITDTVLKMLADYTENKIAVK